jgi:hypothetical protein
MAFVTARKNGTWELRESIATPDGPRSRTLASFRTLTDDIVAHAQSRASRPFDADDVRAAARRAGAPVDLEPADRAAGDLLRELADGRQPHPILRALLIDALQEAPPVRLGEKPAPQSAPLADVLPFETPHNARAGAAWLTRTPKERAEALDDLLDLADQFPRDRAERMNRERFPRLDRAS